MPRKMASGDLRRGLDGVIQRLDGMGGGGGRAPVKAGTPQGGGRAGGEY
jgi:hypothetical protein